MESKLKIERSVDVMDPMLSFASLLLIMISILIGKMTFLSLKKNEAYHPGLRDSLTKAISVASSGKKVTARLLIERGRMKFDLLDEETAEPIEKMFGEVSREKVLLFFKKLKQLKNTYPMLETLMISVYERVRYEQVTMVLDIMGAPVVSADTSLKGVGRALAKNQLKKFKFNLVMLPKTRKEEL